MQLQLSTFLTRLLQWGLVLVVINLGYRTGLFVYRWIRQLAAFRSAQRKRGCQRPAKYPHKSMFGFDLYQIRKEASIGGKSVQHYDRLFERLGRTWEERVMDKKLINTINPKNIQHILATGIDDFRKIGQKSSFRTLLGGGIFLSNGPKWKHSRDLIKPTFAKVEISDLKSFGNYASRLVSLIPRDGSTFDIQPLMKKMFLDSSTEFIFGESMNSMLQKEAHGAADSLLSDLTLAIQGINKRLLAWSRLQYCRDKSFPDSVKRVHSFIDQHVADALMMTADEDEETGKGSTPRRFVLLHEMARQMRDPIQLRYEILNIFMASRDTISTLVSNALFQLARHPHVWHDLRTTALSLGAQPDLSFDNLKSLLPFRHVINETFRTIGPTGKATRIAVRDTILPTGGGFDGRSPVFVSRGTFVVIPNNSLHHDRDIWGDDALEFRPERWSNRKSTPWEFIPFIGGPRICPAQQMVTVQAIYLLVLLTREFERIENRDPIHEYIEEAQLLLTESRNGVLIALAPATAQE